MQGPTDDRKINKIKTKNVTRMIPSSRAIGKASGSSDEKWELHSKARQKISTLDSTLK
jgi:hypothetical protein